MNDAMRHGPAPRPLCWAVAAFAAGVLLHADRLPWWCTLIVLVLAAWRLAGELGPLALPGRLARLSIAAVLVVAVLGSFRTLNGLDAGTALLTVMGGLKLLETRERRDRYIVIGAALFLLLAACLDRQELPRVLLYGAQAWLSCAALAVVGDESGTLGSRPALRLAGRTLLLALPLALVLFLFFPRLAGGFWALPPGGRALTGLDDRMSPGSIAELTENDAVAFRVWFPGPVPPPQERYWRGPVLNDFDGYTWRRTPATLHRQTPLEYLGTGYRYRVALEPHSRPWWFALETVTAAPDSRARFEFDYLLASEPVETATTYEAVSHPRTRALAPLSALGRRIGTRLPQDRNPRSRALARHMRAAAASDAAFAADVLDLFRKEGFEYSLTPPRTDFDFVDDFLFETRRGFCGHYASAYTALMRAAGVPARVVTGYLGGEWNPIGGYYVVRQSDAHAWAEIWLEGRGWTRIDPTAAVAPERLTRGILDILPDAVSAPARLVHAQQWLTRLRHRWDAANTWWRRQVVGFDFRAQLSLLEKLGFQAPGAHSMVLVLAAASLVWLAWLAWRLRAAVRPARREDALARAWLRLCAKLAPLAVRRRNEGPLAYAERLGTARPDLAAEIRELAASYARLRFGGEPHGTAVAAFARRVRRLDLRPRARSGILDATSDAEQGHG